MLYSQMKALIGKRIEIPAHYDTWMRGARFGTITSTKPEKSGLSSCLLVRMDHPYVRRRVKVWSHDIEYARIIGESP